MALTLDSVLALLERQLQPTLRRVGLMISRGVIRRVDDSTKAQTVQLSLLGDPAEEDAGGVPDEETPDDVEHVQPFGLTFVPPASAEVVALSVGGNRDYVIALGASSRDHRPTEVRVPFGEGGGSVPRGLDEGEGGLYSLDGWRLFLDAAGNIYLGGGPDTALYKLARADLVEGELRKVQTALSTAVAPSGGGAVTYGTPYAAVGAVGSEKAKVVG